MKIKFKLLDEETIRIVGINDEGQEKAIGKIFTPSGSGTDNANAIQICGFTEAFDLWGCANFLTPKTKQNGDIYVYDKEGKKEYNNAKDIQLLFEIDTIPNQKPFRTNTLNCWQCFNEPCTCEIKEKYANPYTVKREQDLIIQKKEEKSK